MSSLQCCGSYMCDTSGNTRCTVSVQRHLHTEHQILPPTSLSLLPPPLSLYHWLTFLSRSAAHVYHLCLSPSSLSPSLRTPFFISFLVSLRPLIPPPSFHPSSITFSILPPPLFSHSLPSPPIFSLPPPPYLCRVIQCDGRRPQMNSKLK